MSLLEFGRKFVDSSEQLFGALKWRQVLALGVLGGAFCYGTFDAHAKVVEFRTGEFAKEYGSTAAKRGEMLLDIQAECMLHLLHKRRDWGHSFEPCEMVEDQAANPFQGFLDGLLTRGGLGHCGIAFRARPVALVPEPVCVGLQSANLGGGIVQLALQLRCASLAVFELIRQPLDFGLEFGKDFASGEKMRKQASAERHEETGEDVHGTPLWLSAIWFVVLLGTGCFIGRMTGYISFTAEMVGKNHIEILRLRKQLKANNIIPKCGGDECDE